MKPYQSAAPPSSKTGTQDYFRQSAQLQSRGPTFSEADPSGNTRFGSQHYFLKQQDTAVRPLQEVCDQSVVSVQIDDSRTSTRQNVFDEVGHGLNVPVETSVGENIQDSILDYQLQLPSCLRGQVKILDNQKSISVPGSTPALYKEVSEDAQCQSTRRDKQTTIKKLAENQANLFKKCTKILNEVNEEMTLSEQKLAACSEKYNQLVKETQQVEYQLENLLVKYTLTKETELAEIYNLVQMKTTQNQVEAKSQSSPVSYTPEQQVLILGLLRFKVLTPEHFRVIFGEQQVLSSNSLTAANGTEQQQFIDMSKVVPFISSDIQTNAQLEHLAPAFLKLKEMDQQIKATKERLKQVEQKKGAAYFSRIAETKRIGQHRSDKRELLDLVNQLQANLKEVVDRKAEIIRRYEIQQIIKLGGNIRLCEEKSHLVDEERLDVSDFLVGKVLYTEKKVLEAINKLHFIREAVRKSRSTSDSTSDILSQHLRQTMISRNLVETEFMKKKIHFVSEFKLYSDDMTQNFKQAMHAASHILSPPPITRNQKPDLYQEHQTTRQNRQKSVTKLGALISGRSQERITFECKQTENFQTGSYGSPRKVGLSARNQDSQHGTPNYIGNTKAGSRLGQFRQLNEKTQQSPKSTPRHQQQKQTPKVHLPAGDLTASYLHKKHIISNSFSLEESKNTGFVQNNIQVSIRGNKEVLYNPQSHSRKNSDALSPNNLRMGTLGKNQLLRNLSVERLDIENGEKMEPQFESDGSVRQIIQLSGKAPRTSFGNQATATVAGSRSNQQNLRDKVPKNTLILDQIESRNQKTFVYGVDQNGQISDRKKFEKAPGCSEGLDKKIADQSVLMGDSLNESSIQLHPNIYTDLQIGSSRRSTNKLQEKQSDEPANQSDEDRGSEIDIEELEIGDIALKGEKTARRAHGVSANQSNEQNQKQWKKKCASVNDNLSLQSPRSNTHHSYEMGSESQIHYEPVLDTNALTKKTSAATHGRPPMHTLKQENILDSSNNLSSNSVKNKQRQDGKQRARRQPRSLKTLESPDRRATTASQKDAREAGHLINSEEKKETQDSFSQHISAQKSGLVSAKTKSTQKGCFSCFCLPNPTKYQSPQTSKQAAQSQYNTSEGSSEFRLEKKFTR